MTVDCHRGLPIISDGREQYSSTGPILRTRMSIRIRYEERLLTLSILVNVLNFVYSIGLMYIYVCKPYSHPAYK